MPRIALYQPDIPQNVGAAMRLCACMGVALDIIEPCGFPWDDAKIRRAAMDYIDQVELTRHSSWESFQKTYEGHRIILMTTKSDTPYLDFTFEAGDILLAGRESAGVPLDIHEAVSHSITIDMPGGGRSMNVINATAMILGEVIRQVNNASR